MSPAVPSMPLAAEQLAEFRAQMREYPIGRWLTGTGLPFFAGIVGGLAWQAVQARWPGLLGVDAIAGMTLFGVVAALLATLLRNFMAGQLHVPDTLLRTLQTLPSGDPDALHNLQGVLKRCHRINWYHLLCWHADQSRYAARHRKLSAVEKTLLAKSIEPAVSPAGGSAQYSRD